MNTRCLPARRLGPFTVSALGLGCMGMSHAYGTPDDAASMRVLHGALDLGITFLDTASLYGFGRNEALLGATLKQRRGEYVLATKGGMVRTADGRRMIDGRPEELKRSCEESLRRLQTEVIDLYYLHRVDRRVPFEDSLGALAELVAEGKVKAIGLSEVSADTLRRAHALHPIAALQTEYSLWTRNAEIKVLSTCRELGIGFVAFSPLARAFLSGALRSPAQLPQSDLRRRMPRFQPGNFSKNLRLLDAFSVIATDNGCTPAQLALAWLLAQGEHVVPIPGTCDLRHLEENSMATELRLRPETQQRLDALFTPSAIAGPRYDGATQQEIGTEEFAVAAPTA